MPVDFNLTKYTSFFNDMELTSVTPVFILDTNYVTFHLKKGEKRINILMAFTEMDMERMIACEEDAAFTYARDPRINYTKESVFIEDITQPQLLPDADCQKTGCED